MRDDLMVQQQVANDWQHMVGVICLNQTGRKKVKELLPAIKKFWKEGLVPFYNDVLVPLGELLADYTTVPLATAVFALEVPSEASEYALPTNALMIVSSIALPIAIAALAE